MKCRLCKAGFPLRGPVHLSSQRLGMIPVSLCAGAVTTGQVDGLRALRRASGGRLLCGSATGSGKIHWLVADGLIGHGLAVGRRVEGNARPYAVEVSELGREVLL